MGCTFLCSFRVDCTTKVCWGCTVHSGNFVDRINDEDYPQYQPQPKPLLNTVQETVAGRLKAEHVPHLMDHVKVNTLLETHVVCQMIAEFSRMQTVCC